MTRYAAPWDRKLKLSTTLFVLVLAGVGGWILSQGTGPEPEALPGPLPAVPIVVGAIAVLAWALAPRGFSVESGRIRVERLLWPIEIPLREVRSAEVLSDGALGATVRLMGAGGAFGYYGRFWSRRLGHYRLYATRLSGLVRLVTPRGTFVLSPDPAGRFVEEVLARAPSARPAPALEPGALPAPRRVWLVPVVLGGLIALFVGGVMAASWAWAPRSVSVVDGEVVVERQWVEPERIPLATVREVRLLSGQDFRGWRRVAGVANLGRVSYGRYRSDALGTFQLYHWRRGAHVLLETGTGKVVVTPDDWRAFVNDVRAGLSQAPLPAEP
jgi:Bacterial PH domain